MRAMQPAPGAVAGALGTLALSAWEPVRDALLGRPPVYAVKALATLGARRAWGVRLSPRSALRWGLLARWLNGPALRALYAAPRPLLRVTPPWRTWSRGEKVLLDLQVLLFGVITEAVLSRRGAPQGPGPRKMGLSGL